MSEPQVQGSPVPVSILIVDDNEKQLLALESILEGLDLELVAVTSGRAALRELLHRTFALVLLDVNLPGMDGFEIAALMRQRRQCQSTPIIFMTAYGDDAYLQRGYSLGAVDFMLTPIVPEVLRTKVSVFIELHRQTERVRQQARRLEQRTAQLAALARQLTIAEERERRRVAQLIHDDIQQLLAAAMMMTRTLADTHPSLGPPLDQLHDIVDEALDASRSLARQVSPPTLRTGGLVAALAELAEGFRRNHALDCTVSAPEQVPRLTDAVEGFLYQATAELLLNVAKHAQAGMVRVSVTASDPAVRVRVEDDGIGFPDSAQSVENGGHFGLQSIRQRLDLFDGSLTTGQPAGGGAFAEMTLPLRGGNLPETAPGQPAKKLSPAASGPAPCGRSIRLLIADDHEMIRRGLRAMLAGHSRIAVVGEARNGREAVDLAAHLEPDVILMDLAMPHGTGLEATREIVDRGAGARVVAMSTNDEESFIQPVLEAGAVGFLSKTCSLEELVSAIRTACQ